MTSVRNDRLPSQTSTSGQNASLVKIKIPSPSEWLSMRIEVLNYRRLQDTFWLGGVPIFTGERQERPAGL